MKYAVLHDFKGKAEKKTFRAGEVVDFTKKRADEIEKAYPGLLSRIVEEKEATK